MNELVPLNEIEIVEDSQEVEVWQKGKKPISFLKCSTCYLKKECKFVDFESDTCALKEIETIDTSTGEGIVVLIQTLLAAQAERVLRFIKIEETEGGLPDPNVTNELMTFMTMVEKLKRIMSDDDFLIIKSKGRATQGILDRLFGDM